MPHAVLACEDAPNDLGHRLMLLWRLRCCGSFVVCRGNIRKQIARVLFADDFEVSQRKEERLADTKSGHALGTNKPRVLGHLVIPSTANLLQRSVVWTDPNQSNQ